MDKNANRKFTAGEEHRPHHRDEVNRLIHRLTSVTERTKTVAGNATRGQTQGVKQHTNAMRAGPQQRPVIRQRLSKPRRVLPGPQDPHRCVNTAWKILHYADFPRTRGYDGESVFSPFA